jgi:hypothetical protein
MQYSKQNTVSPINRALNVKGIMLSLAATMLLSGCGLFDSKDISVP